MPDHVAADVRVSSSISSLLTIQVATPTSVPSASSARSAVLAPRIHELTAPGDEGRVARLEEGVDDGPVATRMPGGP